MERLDRHERPEAPQVAKRWKTNPRYQPNLKSFASGYVMKLEFGELTNNIVPGKIYLALPDTEQNSCRGTLQGRRDVDCPTDGYRARRRPASQPGGSGRQGCDGQALRRKTVTCHR